MQRMVKFSFLKVLRYAYVVRYFEALNLWPDQ